jgi:hypothetical protein
MTQPLIVVKPVPVTAFVSSDVPEVAPDAYNGGTTYAIGNQVSVAGALGLQTVYESLQNSNTGHTPASSPTWWKSMGTVYQAYSGGATYGLGERVQDNSAHVIYESAVAGNTGNPLSDVTKWVRVSKTNLYKAFDTANSSATTKPNSMSFRFTPGQGVGALGVLNIQNATSMRRRVIDPTYGTVHDQTTDLSALPASSDWWAWAFGVKSSPSLSVATDLPAVYINADIQLDFTGGADLAIGTIIVGPIRQVGIAAQSGVRLSFKDYSKQNENAFGDLELVEGNYSKLLTFQVPMLSSEVDQTFDLIASLRATPCLWIGSQKYRSTVVYGICAAPEIVIQGERITDTSIQLRGLT